MFKFAKYFSAFAVTLILAIALASCGGYNFYDVWTEAGAIIEKDHPFEVIEVNDAKDKIAADDTFVLVLGTPTTATAVTTLGSMYQQAKAVDFDGVIHFIDVEDELDGITSRKEVKEALGINNLAEAKNNLIVVCYNNGEIIVDTSLKVTDDSLENYVSNGQLDFSALSAYIFNDFVFEE